ncbi:MAG: hypothetical protein HQL23_07785 [Candidatus Omnitrophica bacterium]|nr:hypothetical protein [Candidatus Omnitrophota bacterium]
MRRYLIWCYKTAKEALDRIDRYYTQLEIDQSVLDVLRDCPAYIASGAAGKDFVKRVDDFEVYMREKRRNVDAKKFNAGDGKQLSGEYVYLRERMRAIEKAIIRFLGRPELARIHQLYETEMTRRILEAREHT